MIQDADIREKVDAIGSADGVKIKLGNGIRYYAHMDLTRYEAFRVIRFIEQAISVSCDLSRESIDHNFAR